MKSGRRNGLGVGARVGENGNPKVKKLAHRRTLEENIKTDNLTFHVPCVVILYEVGRQVFTPHPILCG